MKTAPPAKPNSILAVLILTHNEGMHIARSIESVRAIATEIFLIDSYSKDSTVSIAESLGAKVIQHPFKNYADQFQWGLDNAPITADWIMRLDADEIIEPDLAQNISQFLANPKADVAGINFKRKHVFLGRWIKHGGRYPLVLLRMWRKGQGRIENRWMDEHMLVWGGKTITMEGGFADHNLNDLTFFTDKHNKYATREAIDIINQKLGLFARDDGVKIDSTSLQASAKRFIKESIYNRLPFSISTLAYFIWRYIFQLGFLDGRPGLVYHFLQGYWYRFLVGAKVMELEAAIAHLHDKKDIIEELSRLTGHKLN